MNARGEMMIVSDDDTGLSVGHLVGRWYVRAQGLAEAHFIRSRVFRCYHNSIGGLAVGASGVLGTLASVERQGVLEQFCAFALPALTVAVPALTALAAFLRFGERADSHHRAGARFSALKRELDEIRVTVGTATGQRKAAAMLMDVRRRWDKLSERSPALYKGDWPNSNQYDRSTGQLYAREVRGGLGFVGVIVLWWRRREMS